MDRGGNNQSKPSLNSQPYFHSVNVEKSKAAEKQEYFKNVRKEPKFKKPQFKSDFKEKLKKVNLKKVGLASGAVVVLVLALIFLAPRLADLLPTDKTPAEAAMLTETDPEEGIKVFEKLIFHAGSNEEKAALLISRAHTLYSSYKETYKTQILKDARGAYKFSPNRDTASAIAEYEKSFGNDSESDYWQNIADNTKDDNEELEGRG